jgi:DNA-binding protein YbaB
MPMLIMPDNIIDRDSVQVAYIDNLVDDMDLETMKELLCEFMNESYDKVSIDDLIEEVEHFYPELLES